MTTVLEVQRALLARGFDVGKAGPDGLIGPSTLNAIMQSLANDPVIGGVVPMPAPKPLEVLPADWLPWAQMHRIIGHWTAGTNTVSVLDLEHYHIIVDGTGKPVRGKPSIALNQAPVKSGYAAHTLNCNSGSIGVSLAGMAGAVQSPLKVGKHPINKAQWDTMIQVMAQLARRYSIPVTPATILTHAEVQATLGIKQKGKWDIAVLPFDLSKNTAAKVGNAMRAAVTALL